MSDTQPPRRHPILTEEDYTTAAAKLDMVYDGDAEDLVGMLTAARDDEIVHDNIGGTEGCAGCLTEQIADAIARAVIGQSPQPSISSVVAGELPEGAVVTVTGVANGPTMHLSKQQNPWVEFWLCGTRTAVRVRMGPNLYREQHALLAPVPDSDGVPRPPALTVTGNVWYAMPPYHPLPALMAAKISRAEGV